MAGVAPVVKSYTLLDAGEVNALSIFGAYVQGQSKPRFKISTTLDPNNPDISVKKRTMTIKDPDGKGIIFNVSSWDFTTPIPTKAGTYTWSYSITDSEGNTNVPNKYSQGTFEVLPYAPPKINTFNVARYTEELDDEGNVFYVESEYGTKVWIDLDVDIVSVAGKNEYRIVTNYESLDGNVGETITLEWMGIDGERIVLEKDKNAITSSIDVLHSYCFSVYVSDVFSEVTETVVVEKAGADFEVGPFGIGVGGRCTGRRGNPKNDFYHPSEFRGGIVGVTIYSGNEVKTGGVWIDNKPIYRRVVTAEISAINTFCHTERIYDVDTVVKVDSIFADRTLNVGMFSSHYYSADGLARCYYSHEDGRFRGVYWSNRYTGTAHMIVEYTKTTDVPGDNGSVDVTDYKLYGGSYYVTPRTSEQTLPTKDTVLIDDVTVHKIPYSEVSNNAGGTTVTIG